MFTICIWLLFFKCQSLPLICELSEIMEFILFVFMLNEYMDDKLTALLGIKIFNVFINIVFKGSIQLRFSWSTIKKYVDTCITFVLIYIPIKICMHIGIYFLSSFFSLVPTDEISQNCPLSSVTCWQKSKQSFPMVNSREITFVSQKQMLLNSGESFLETSK